MLNIYQLNNYLVKIWSIFMFYNVIITFLIWMYSMIQK